MAYKNNNTAPMVKRLRSFEDREKQGVASFILRKLIRHPMVFHDDVIQLHEPLWGAEDRPDFLFNRDFNKGVELAQDFLKRRFILYFLWGRPYLLFPSWHSSHATTLCIHPPQICHSFREVPTSRFIQIVLDCLWFNIPLNLFKIKRRHPWLDQNHHHHMGSTLKWGDQLHKSKRSFDIILGDHHHF